MANREEFIKAVRHRTRTGQYKPTIAPDSAWTPTGEPQETTIIHDPPARFLEELEALGGRGQRVENLDEARVYVVSLAQEREAKLIIRWDVEELENLAVDKPLRKVGTEVVVWRALQDFRKVSAEANIGLSTAEWAVAETGSLVLASGVGKGRSVTLLPPTYVAIVPVERVLSTVAEVVERYARGGRLPANLCFHTGPSRSGDIEMSLAIGVHGPGDVHVLLVG